MVQAVPLSEVWIWNARAYAASQRSTTRLMVKVAPRSTLSHCGSLNVLDQRVRVLPSTAADAGVDAFSVDEEVAGLPWDSRSAAAVAGGAAAVSRVSAKPMVVASAISAVMARGRVLNGTVVSVERLDGRIDLPPESGESAVTGQRSARGRRAARGGYRDCSKSQSMTTSFSYVWAHARCGFTGVVPAV